MTPEENARAEIDAMLTASGWVVQSKDNLNLSAALGVAVCELSFATGETDYTLFADGKALGTIEAKPEGHSLTGVEEQFSKYVTGLRPGLPAWRTPLPFCYESTGSETRFTTSLSIEPEDLELSPLNQSGGLGKAHQLFGNDLNRILDELNLTLIA